jgi:hypothetical protein
VDLSEGDFWIVGVIALYKSMERPFGGNPAQPNAVKRGNDCQTMIEEH